MSSISYSNPLNDLEDIVNVSPRRLWKNKGVLLFILLVILIVIVVITIIIQKLSESPPRESLPRESPPRESQPSLEPNCNSDNDIDGENMEEFKECVLDCLSEWHQTSMEERGSYNSCYENCERHDNGDSQCSFDHISYDRLHGRLMGTRVSLCPKGHPSSGQRTCPPNTDDLLKGFGSVCISGDVDCIRDNTINQNREQPYCFVEEHDPTICNNKLTREECLSNIYPIREILPNAPSHLYEDTMFNNIPICKWND